jgi:hypothetical protein
VAAEAGALLAPRPQRWAPARDASAAAEYVTLDPASRVGQTEEVDTVMRAVDQCNTVSWVAGRL